MGEILPIRDNIALIFLQVAFLTWQYCVEMEAQVLRLCSDLLLLMSL